MALEVLRPAALPHGRDAIAQLFDELLHPVAIRYEGGVGRNDVRRDHTHLGRASAHYRMSPESLDF
jgi:hypothetical protein